MEKKRDKKILILVKMKMIVNLIFVLFFIGCISDKNKDAKISGSDKHRKDLILNSLQKTNPIARQTILQVIDTVEFYKSRLTEWPDSALTPILDKCHTIFFDSLILSKDISFYDEIVMDTFLYNRFAELVYTEELCLSDMIVMADFELINYQYLNKKYTRFVSQNRDNVKLMGKLSYIEPLGIAYSSDRKSVV